MNFSQNNCECTNHDENLVYLTKIFYNNQETASPILATITANQNNFSQELSIGDNVCENAEHDRCRQCDCNCGCDCNCNCGNGCGCGNTRQSQNCGCCCNVGLSQNSTFNITNAFVIVHSFDIAPAASLPASRVTVDGMAITDIARSGNQYLGDLSGIMSEITKCPCKSPCENPCPGNFVLISPDGPWQLDATIVLEGTVFDNGTACQFRVCFRTTEGSPFTIAGGAAFAFCGVEIPCQVAGVAPSLLFDFDACAAILNPNLSVTCSNNNCMLTLTGSLVVTPKVNLQVTRPSLFRLNAREVEIPCDDVGQCNPCNPDHADCFEDRDNCCCGEVRSSVSQGITCQCCDTNGISF